MNDTNHDHDDNDMIHSMPIGPFSAFFTVTLKESLLLFNIVCVCAQNSAALYVIVVQKKKTHC